MKSHFEVEETLLMPVATMPGQPREEEDEDTEDVSYDEDLDEEDDLDDEDELSDLDEEEEL